jgi:FtsP/CotA-like multicopper oxidase with cupredoxin domain
MISRKSAGCSTDVRRTRRRFLQGLAGVALLPALPRVHAATVRELKLVPAVARQQIVPVQYGDTEIWAFNGTAPGPELRFRQGERLRVVVENRLAEPTTVHWHGLRVPNAMDGVPGLTQKAIVPGGRFIYEFDLPDAGTYWYHPHSRSYEQVARGLYGALIVEEREPIQVDRDVTWVLSDFRLSQDAGQIADFDSLMDLTHAGRIGNAIALNGRYPLKDGTFGVRSGERIRLRLVNAAAARIFELRFEGHDTRVIAWDGQAVVPHAPDGGRIALGPGMRADVILDCMNAPGTRHAVIDENNPRRAVTLIEIVYGDDRPLRDSPSAAPIALTANAHAEPEMTGAGRHEIVFGGGAMSGLREALVNGERVPIQSLVREHHLAWTVNGVAVKEHAHEPLLTFRRGSSHVLRMKNDTMWPHPIHIHGHFFRILSRDGKRAPRQEWVDTVLMQPRETVDVALVADNPGDWMFHCHILAHQNGGMMGVMRVL